MKVDIKPLNNKNVHKVIKNKKKKVQFDKKLNQTFTYTKHVDDEENENKANEFSLKQKELYEKEINEYLINKVKKLNPNYSLSLDEDMIEGFLFLFEKKDKLYMVFFHYGELEFKIISFDINIQLNKTFLDFFLQSKLDQLITTFNDIDECFHLDVLVEKIK
jgi:hypothetical protein